MFMTAITVRGIIMISCMLLNKHFNSDVWGTVKESWEEGGEKARDIRRAQMTIEDERDVWMQRL